MYCTAAGVYASVLQRGLCRKSRAIRARVDFVTKFFEGVHMPDQFEQLKQKYQPVLAKIQEEGA
ncbi:MAG: hypothetical protein WB755_13085, partial [Terriglobales bacterium]